VETTHVQKGTKKDDAEGVEVADHIVGNAVASQHSCQEVGGASNSVVSKVSTVTTRRDALLDLPVVVPVLHREEAEHSSGLHSPLDILHELITVASLRLVSPSSNDRWLASIPPSGAADPEDTATRHAVSDDSDSVRQVGSARLVQNQTWLEPHEHERQGNVKQQRKQKCQPPTNVVCSV
jgi:hypothetical protein